MTASSVTAVNGVSCGPLTTDAIYLLTPGLSSNIVVDGTSTISFTQLKTQILGDLEITGNLTSANGGGGGVLGGANGRRRLFGRQNGGGLFGKLDRKKGEFESGRSKRQIQDYQYPDDDYPDGVARPFDIDELFGFKLRNRLKTRLETQFRKHQCVKLQLSGDGTGDTCTNSVECRCGEFCSKQAQNPNLPGKCKPATCSLRGSGVCQTYPGFNHK